VSICTVVDGQFKTAARMLYSVLSTADPVAVELIVANTAGPSPRSDAFVRDFPDVKFFDLAGVSPVQAKNHALRLARGRFIGFFDHDLIVVEGCLKTLVDFLDDRPDVGVAGPQIVDAYGTLARTARAFHTITAVLGQSVAGGVLPDVLWKPKHYLEGWDHRATREVDWLCGGAHLVRRELFEDIGLLAEYVPFFYEQEYYLRSKKNGWHNFYVYEAQVVHPNPGRYGGIAQGPTSKSFAMREVIRFFYGKWFGRRMN
jgi:GT2 family glycosyltransferase